MTTTATPTDLLIYQPSRDKYAISWRINPVYGEDITLMDCTIQRDVVSTFDSVNLTTFTKSSGGVVLYQDGYFFKAFTFDKPILYDAITYYFRVKIDSSTYTSAWSSTVTITFSASTWISDTAMLQGVLADNSTYAKQGITTSGKIIEAYALQIQDLKDEANQIANNVNYYLTQDEDLFNVLGCLLEYHRDSSRPFIEYRRELLDFWEAFLVSGTEASIKKVVKAVLGQDPTFTYLKNQFGWIVHSSQNLPYTFPPTTEHVGPTQHYFLRDPSYVDIGPVMTPYSRYGKALSVIIKIYNPFGLPTRHALIEFLANKMKPANVNIYFQYWKIQTGEGYGDDSGWGEGSWSNEGNWIQYIPDD